MNDRIFVDNLRLNCRVGITSEERKEPQEVTMDISLFLNLKPAAESDSMGETIDYREVRQRVMQFISKREFKLLEALADGTATCLLDSFKAGLSFDRHAALPPSLGWLSLVTPVP
ncbi:MAG: dihydroneopterin aldolase [Nitrososphaerota archaeon]|nr:dihydroneopterin aldolase [Nitrososphaerota archaeon]